jgi:uncharacterized protein YbjT (DUF2867 family)
VVDVAHQRGHDVIILARSAGTDLVTGAGLARKLADAHAVIDVTSTATQSARDSKEFFGAVTRNLLAAEQEVGVPHHIALSIVGSDAAPFGYYAGKAVQEHLVSTGPIPWTILRATQFHEFAEQLYRRFSLGPIHVVPTMFSQPVAAREVAERLMTLAETGPAGRPADLAGPGPLRMADMVRAYAAASGGRGVVLEVPLPGGFGRAMRDRTLLAGPSADLGKQTFAEWATGADRPE